MSCCSPCGPSCSPCGPYGPCSGGGCFPLGCAKCPPSCPTQCCGTLTSQCPTKCCQPSMCCQNPVCPPPMMIKTRPYCSGWDGLCHAKNLIKLPCITVHSQIPNRVCVSPMSTVCFSPGCCPMKCIGPPCQRNICCAVPDPCCGSGCGPCGPSSCCSPCGGSYGGGGGCCGSGGCYDGRLDSSCCGGSCC